MKENTIILWWNEVKQFSWYLILTGMSAEIYSRPVIGQ